MHPTTYPSIQIGSFALVLICLSVVSLFILGFVYFLRFGMGKGWCGNNLGNVFQGPTEWADINEAADRPPPSAYGGEER